MKAVFLIAIEALIAIFGQRAAWSAPLEPWTASSSTERMNNKPLDGIMDCSRLLATAREKVTTQLRETSHNMLDTIKFLIYWTNKFESCFDNLSLEYTQSAPLYWKLDSTHFADVASQETASFPISTTSESVFVMPGNGGTELWFKIYFKTMDYFMLQLVTTRYWMVPLLQALFLEENFKGESQCESDTAREQGNQVELTREISFKWETHGLQLYDDKSNLLAEIGHLNKITQYLARSAHGKKEDWNVRIWYKPDYKKLFYNEDLTWDPHPLELALTDSASTYLIMCNECGTSWSRFNVLLNALQLAKMQDSVTLPIKHKLTPSSRASWYNPFSWIRKTIEKYVRSRRLSLRNTLSAKQKRAFKGWVSNYSWSPTSSIDCSNVEALICMKAPHPKNGIILDVKIFFNVDEETMLQLNFIMDSISKNCDNARNFLQINLVGKKKRLMWFRKHKKLPAILKNNGVIRIKKARIIKRQNLVMVEPLRITYNVECHTISRP